MKSFNLTLTNGLQLTIRPDSDAHADGHPVLTYTYSIYIRSTVTDADLTQENKTRDPAYFGSIIFEQPGKLFSYTDDGQNHLSREEVEELIEEISHYRDTPKMCRI